MLGTKALGTAALASAAGSGGGVSPATKLGLRQHALGSANGLATSNKAFDYQPVVLIQDAGGGTVTTDNSTVVTATITSGAGTLIGTVTKTAALGVADFGADVASMPITNPYLCNFLGINGIGTYTITYSATGLTSIANNPITTTAGSFARQVAGTGTVSCTAGAASFSLTQAGKLDNNQFVIIGGTQYFVTAFNGALGCTLAPYTPFGPGAAPTFGASAFSIASFSELPRVTPTRTQLVIDGDTYLVTAATIWSTVDAIQADGSVGKRDKNHLVRIKDGEIVTARHDIPQRAGGGTGWIQIESETLPCAFGTLVRPSNFTTQAIFDVTTDRYIIGVNATGLANVRLVGLHIRVNPSNAFPTVYDLIRNGETQTALAQVPIGLKVERCYLHGKSGSGALATAVVAWGQDTAIFNCWMQDIQRYGSQESQSIALGAGPGPVLIEDNYLEACGENIIVGGFDPGLPQVVPADVTIRRNHLNCPRSFQFAGVQHKNLYEPKMGRRFLIEGNVFENAWVGAQDGTAILINSLSGGNAPWCGSYDMTLRKNFCRNAEGFIGFFSGTGSTRNARTDRITVHDNVAPNISIEPNPTYYGAQRFFFVGADGVFIVHNTLLAGVNTALTRIAGFSGPNSALRHVFRDNLVAAASPYCVSADGTAPGGLALASAAPGVVWHHNACAAFAGNDAFTQTSMVNGGYVPNSYPTTVAGLGLTNAGISSTWDTADPDAVCAALALLTGPYRAGQANQASDGLDVGADIPAVRAAIAGVWTGSLGGGADHLAVTRQPSAATLSNVPHAVQPAVTVQDASNATVIGDTSVVTASLVVLSGAGAPIGTLAKAAVAGIADFAGNGLGVNGVGTFKWHFTDGALISIDSAAFTVTSAPISYAASPTRVVPPTFAIKQGDTAPPLVRTLAGADGVAQDLTGATVRFSMRLVNGPVIISRILCTIVDAPNGKVKYLWQAADTVLKGTCLGEFEVTLADGSIITFPDDGYHVVTITPQIA